MKHLKKKRTYIESLGKELGSMQKEEISGNNWGICNIDCFTILERRSKSRGQWGVPFRKKQKYMQIAVMRKRMLAFLGQINGEMKREKAKRD